MTALPTTYEDPAEVLRAPLGDRYAVTGEGVEADFAKLVRLGCIQGSVADPLEWRADVRRLARRMQIKVRTYTTGKVVIAHTLAYERWLQDRMAGDER